jgi:hypothetical protein
MGLMELLTELRDSAHGLTNAELADAEGGRERREQARVLQARLGQAAIELAAAPESERPSLENLVQATERYLILFTFEDLAPEEGESLLSLARSLHQEVIDYARGMVRGEPDGTIHDAAAADFRNRLDALLADPGPRNPELQGLLGDADLDVEFVRYRGDAPSSLRLARETRG